MNAAAPADPSNIPGFDSTHPWRHPWKAWKAIFGRIYVMTGYHNLSLMAAGMAFFAFLSIVPLLGAIVMTYGLVADPATVAAHMKTIIQLVPADAARLIQDQLTSIASTAADKAGLGLAIALFFSLFGAMRAAGGMIGALNVVYEEDETRSIIRTTLLSLVLTVGAVFAAIIGVIAAAVLGYLKQFADILGHSGVVLIQIATWIVAGAIASGGFAFVYRFGPDRARAEWRWLSIGSVASTLLWLLATVLFGLYAANFANYNATYGALGAVVVLLMWLYVSAYAILIGAEINAEAERQTGVDSTTGTPRPFGERGATVADTLPSQRQVKPKRSKY
ncbi:YihY/virulence factor BrkB family protein [Stakelama marina]|uniref:YihY/virulence factor BrkB family protein n=1 Tax=Stakelama marina TaxID=2826939 RepID=A0A8T4IGH2_9SPHN|nr:YihY/virulence factor BrkB family protein [Stakelama marina]MBR0551359.1 YihY/virulence factor BrkB family protein [Stakelama marina]